MASRTHAAVWKALSDPTRRKLLDLLKRRPRTTGQLCARFDVSRYAVMKHLAVLERAGLVVVRRDGRRRWNHLNAVPLRQVYERWVGGYASHWAESLVGLKQFVESQPEGGAAMGATTEASRKPGQTSTFYIEQEVLIRAPRGRVFDAITRDVGQWWAFRLSDTGSTLALEPRVGGRFFEDMGNGEGALWGVVTYIKRPERLRLSGPLGMTTPVVSIYTYDLSDADEDGRATLLKLSHHVTGDPAPQAEEKHRQGWGKLLTRYLKAYVEEGKRYTEVEETSAR